MEQLLERWRDEGVGLQPGASDRDIATIEGLLGASLPEDARAFYARMNGMTDFDYDGWFVSMWSAGRMLSERELTTGTDERGEYAQVAFADVMISSWFFWLRVRDGGVVTVFAELTAEEFPSFSAFVERYLQDPEALCLVAVERRPT
jgi:hypothetical protein